LKVPSPTTDSSGACIEFRNLVAATQAVNGNKAVNYAASFGLSKLEEMVNGMNRNPVIFHLFDGRPELLKVMAAGQKTSFPGTPYTKETIASQSDGVLMHLFTSSSAPTNRRGSQLSLWQTCILNLEGTSPYAAIQSFFSGLETLLTFWYQLLNKTLDKAVQSRWAGVLFPHMHSDQHRKATLAYTIKCIFEAQMPGELYEYCHCEQTFMEIEEAREQGEYDNLGPLEAASRIGDKLLAHVENNVAKMNAGVRDPSKDVSQTPPLSKTPYVLSATEAAKAKAAQLRCWGSKKARMDTEQGSRRVPTLASLQGDFGTTPDPQMEALASRQEDMINQVASLVATTQNQQLSLTLLQNGFERSAAQFICETLASLQVNGEPIEGAGKLHDLLMLAARPQLNKPSGYICFAELFSGECHIHNCRMLHSGKPGYKEACRETSNILLGAALNVKDEEAKVAVKRVYERFNDGLNKADMSGSHPDQSAREAYRSRDDVRDHRAEPRSQSGEDRRTRDSREPRLPPGRDTHQDTYRDDRGRHRNTQPEPPRYARNDTPPSRDSQAGRLDAQSPTNVPAIRTEARRDRQEPRYSPAPPRSTAEPDSRGGNDSTQRVQFETAHPPHGTSPPRDRYPPTRGGDSYQRGAGGSHQAEHQMRRSPGGGMNSIVDEDSDGELEDKEVQDYYRSDSQET